MQRWDLLSIDAPEGTRDPVVLHQDEAARAVLIVLSPGQQLGRHQVKEHMWVLVVDGSVRVTAGTETTEAGRGAMFRFDAHEPHALASEEGARVVMLLAPWPGAGHYPDRTIGEAVGLA